MLRLVKTTRASSPGQLEADVKAIHPLKTTRASSRGRSRVTCAPAAETGHRAELCCEPSQVSETSRACGKTLHALDDDVLLAYANERLQDDRKMHQALQAPP